MSFATPRRVKFHVHLWIGLVLDRLLAPLGLSVNVPDYDVPFSVCWSPMSATLSEGVA